MNKLLAAESLHPSQGWQPAPHHLSKEQLWQAIQAEARTDAVGAARRAAPRRRPQRPLHRALLRARPACRATLREPRPRPPPAAPRCSHPLWIVQLEHWSAWGPGGAPGARHHPGPPAHLLLSSPAAQAAEPALASFLFSTVLVHSSLEKSLSFLLANKLANATMLGTQLMRLVQEAYEDSPALVDAACADLQAVQDRDPACDK